MMNLFNQKDILYLASQSASRRELLQAAGIQFTTIDQTSDESSVAQTGSVHDFVIAIARTKMDCAILPERIGAAHDYLFVLTADSLTFHKESGTIFGKPKDKDDARRMLNFKQDKIIEVATGCCLEKKVWNGTAWETQAKTEWVASGALEFFLTPEDIEKYLESVPQALHASGAGVIEGFGFNFLKTVNGSYTAIMGLPLFELRQALKGLKFKF